MIAVVSMSPVVVTMRESTIRTPRRSEVGQ